MIPYRLDYTIEKVLTDKLSKAQIRLKQFTGKLFKKVEAEDVLARVENHRWHLSENLGRDVGFRVALFDFLENFSNSQPRPKPTN
jgi:hypothetical protein